ncbi:MAG: phosphoadenosine phosphosulfate reductase [Clostridiales bacterium]|nr:phosphoadenosine phosphosulfate reductase [Clostridiales bacterium]
MSEQVVAWISAGMPSFVAAYCMRNIIGKTVYIHLSDQHPDSLRFIHDCDEVLGLETEIIRNDQYQSVNDVIRKTRFINSPYGARCTTELKIKVREKWERKNLKDNTHYIWGMLPHEKHRAERLKKSIPYANHIFPLIDKDINADKCCEVVASLGVRPPAMYELGYNNNNCIGCVKGGMWYWNEIRQDFPVVFQERARLEREIGRSCIKGVFLDELEEGRGRQPKIKRGGTR